MGQLYSKVLLPLPRPGLRQSGSCRPGDSTHGVGEVAVGRQKYVRVLSLDTPVGPLEFCHPPEHRIAPLPKKLSRLQSAGMKGNQLWLDLLLRFLASRPQLPQRQQQEFYASKFLPSPIEDPTHHFPEDNFLSPGLEVTCCPEEHQHKPLAFLKRASRYANI
jgi:hypothetical protein